MHFEKFFSGEGTASEKKDYRQPLAWILYYDKNKNMLYYYPNEDDLEPTKISLDTQKPKWNSYPNSKSKQKEKNLEYSFYKLLSEMKKLKSEEMQKTGMKILYKLRYFIKLSDFAEEKELRVLQLIDPTDEAIEDDGENYIQIILIFGRMIVCTLLSLVPKPYLPFCMNFMKIDYGRIIPMFPLKYQMPL